MSGEGLISDGYYEEGFAGSSSLLGPTIGNISPGGNLTPGQPGAFSATFSTATKTPLTFQLTGITAGAKISITVKYANRDEKYVALDFAGSWCWPFDVVGPNNNNIGSLSSEPVHVQLLPRDGWPPGQFFFEVAAAAKGST